MPVPTVVLDANVIIECALVGMAEYLVTGDQDLLIIGPYQSVQIITPGNFITALPRSRH